MSSSTSATKFLHLKRRAITSANMERQTLKELDPVTLKNIEMEYLTRHPGFRNLVVGSILLAPKTSTSTCRRRRPPTPRSCVSLGLFERLPPEILQMDVAMTPFRDLMRLRGTNTFAERIVEQWRPFCTVMAAGRNIANAILQTEVNCLWTTPQVVDVIFTTKYEFCGDHGEFVQLLRLKRCCFRCLSQERELLAVDFRFARGVLGMNQDDVGRLPQLCTLPQQSFSGETTR
jgi:hypothetical protein